MKHQGLAETKIIIIMGKHEPTWGQLIDYNEIIRYTMVSKMGVIRRISNKIKSAWS